jgi:hypothetical protein
MPETLDMARPLEPPTETLVVAPPLKTPAPVWPPVVVPSRPRAKQSPGWAPAVGLLVSATGAIIVAAAYRAAQAGTVPAAYYALFWVGALLLVAPSVYATLRKGTRESARAWALLALGVCTYVPKFLRNPYGPLYHDELAHFRAVQDLIHSHHLYAHNPIITIIGDFPGLHIVTAAVEQLSGLTFWQTATIIILLAHCSALMAVYYLGRLLLPNSRAAAVMAVLYATNSGFLYFDTEFAYESLAVSYFFWVVGLTVTASRRSSGGWRASVLAGGLTLACAVTHHLTTVVLVVLCAIVVVAHIVRRVSDGARWRGSPWRPFAITALVAASGFGFWILAVAHETYAYLRPYLGAASHELAGQASGAGGGRTLYATSVEPIYERVLGLLSPVATAVLFAWSVLRTRFHAQRENGGTLLGLTAFGALYFPSLVFILSRSGAEGARRSWDFTYLGVALTIAACAGPWLARLWQRRGMRWLISGALVGLFIGNVGAGLDDPYRFPGPYLYGSDTRSLTTEDISVGKIFGEDHGGSRVVTDRYTGLALVAYGNAFTAAPSSGFPTYTLWTRAGTPSPYLVHELESSHYRYMVVDGRTARFQPQVGTYFEPDEPSQLHISARALTELNDVPWATKVIATNNYSVYRLNFTAVGVPSCGTRACGEATR